MPSGSWVIDQNNILHILINNSRNAAWLTHIFPMPFLSFSQNICFRKSAANFGDSTGGY